MAEFVEQTQAIFLQLQNSLVDNLTNALQSKPDPEVLLIDPVTPASLPLSPEGFAEKVVVRIELYRNFSLHRSSDEHVLSQHDFRLPLRNWSAYHIKADPLTWESHLLTHFNGFGWFSEQYNDPKRNQSLKPFLDAEVRPPL